MKVISIRQPWASLIINGYKEYEFRSWNIKFRGKCLIHASQSVEKDMMDRFKCLNLKYPVGKIIGSVKITDCIKVNKSFEKELIEKNELVYGATQDRDGYAFELKNIEIFEMPIGAKGELGFWDYYNEHEIMEKMKNIKYGWIDKKSDKNSVTDKFFSENYRLQNPKEVIKNKIGVCWDQVELERYYFKNWNNIKTYFICHYDNDKCPSHTFLTYEKDNKYYWFEHSWEKYRGIHKFDNEKEILKTVKNNFIESELNNKYEKSNLLIREYKKATPGISVIEFYKHCEKCISIDVGNL